LAQSQGWNIFITLQIHMHHAPSGIM